MKQVSVIIWTLVEAIIVKSIPEKFSILIKTISFKIRFPKVNRLVVIRMWCPHRVPGYKMRFGKEIATFIKIAIRR